MSQKGPVQISVDGSKAFIGEQRVARTIKEEYDPVYPHLFVSAVDPARNVVIWAYKTKDSTDTGNFDKAIIYDYIQNKFVPIELNGQALLSVAQSGITLEGLSEIGSTSISGAADNGSGLIRLTVSSTSGWTTGLIKDVADVGGTTEANATWTITVIDGTHIDLQGSTFVNAYTSGGYVASSIDDIEIPLDDFSTASLPKLGIFNTDSELCFFLGDNLEATLEAAEQTGFRTRTFCNGFMPITDADTVYGSVAGRENLNASPAYNAEQSMNNEGLVPARLSTRYLRAKIRIPAGTEWTYASGVEAMAEADGER
jgi:hypothetical protein